MFHMFSLEAFQCDTDTYNPLTRSSTPREINAGNTHHSKLPFKDYSYMECNGLTKTDAKWWHHDIGDHGLEIMCVCAAFRPFPPPSPAPVISRRCWVRIATMKLCKIHEWFKSSSLSLNIDKTYFLQFHTKTNQKYSDIHGFTTRYDNDFHLPSAKLKLFQKRVSYSGIKTCSHLPKTIKELSHYVKQFSFTLKSFLYQIHFILWKSILKLTRNEWCSVIQVTLFLVKWHVGFNPEIFLIF